MKTKTQLLELLGAACLAAVGLMAPIANAGTIVVGAAPGGGADLTARHLARSLGGSYIVVNKPGLDAASSAQQMQGKATDGSEMMIVVGNDESTAAGRLPPVSVYAHLTPVANLGVSTTGKSWYGLFAPPGTPASVVSSLNARVRQAISTMPPVSPSAAPLIYAQDMSAAALSQRLASAIRAQPAAASVPAAVPSATTTCAAERARANGTREREADTDEKAEILIWDHWSTYMYGRYAGQRQALSNPKTLREYADSVTATADGYHPSHGIKYSYLLMACLARARADRLERGQAPVARAPNSPVARTDVTATRPTPTSGASPSQPASSSSSRTPPMSRQAIQGAQAQADHRQAQLDEQRRGKPKRHYAEGEAHRCLSLIKATDKTLYGGFINTCDFPVRFAYCAYKPKKGAWSESVDCEGGTGKLSGHSEIKPHERSAHHTLGAEKVLWFACRADGEGFEVGDAEFDRSGPFIRGRCYKWGERS